MKNENKVKGDNDMGLRDIVDGFKSFNEFKVKNGEKKEFFITCSTEDLAEFAQYEHTENFGGSWKTIKCLNDGCPLCMTGRKAAYKLYVPVYDLADNTPKIFRMGKMLTRQLASQEDEYGDLVKRKIKISRIGEKFDTEYTLFVYDKVDIEVTEPVDVKEYISKTFMNRDEIIKYINIGNSVCEDEDNSVDDTTNHPF